jgi:hypothetical protein
MPALLALLLPAFLPVVADGLRGIFSWFTGGTGAKPQNVEEAIKLMEAEAKKLAALAELDRPTGNISTWVADLRASFRYLAAGIIIVATIVAVFAQGAGLPIDVTVLDTLLQLSGSVFSFIFGDRLYLSLRNKK